LCSNKHSDHNKISSLHKRRDKDVNTAKVCNKKHTCLLLLQQRRATQTHTAVTPARKLSTAQNEKERVIDSKGKQLPIAAAAVSEHVGAKMMLITAPVATAAHSHTLISLPYAGSYRVVQLLCL
jgi:phage tail sheath protein FI